LIGKNLQDYKGKLSSGGGGEGRPATNISRYIKNFEGMKSKRRATSVLGISKHSMLVESYVF
jgi:hypothetical protein